MIKTLKIKDNTRVEKSDLNAIPNLVDKVVNKTLEELEKEGVFVFPDLIKDSDDLTKDQMILQKINHNYSSGNVMGFIGLEKERLIIESRFSNGEQDFFFQYLLERVLDVPNVLDLHTNANQENRLFNLLLFLFPYYLKSAIRKGPFKTYIRNLYNDSNVKGTIDIARHIRENTPFEGKIAYGKREFSYDNYLMELIRHTIEFIRIKPLGRTLLNRVDPEIRQIMAVTENYRYFDRRKVIIANQKNPVRHAYYHEYGQLQRLCIMILQQDKHQIGSGTRKIQGILFDGSWLWEEYVHTLIGDEFYHPMNKGGSGVQWLFTNEKNGLQGKIYPDFISKEEEGRYIADAKYKPVENIKNKDYLQVLAYMFRFKSKHGLYLFPDKNNAEEDFILKMNTGTSYNNDVSPGNDVSVTKIGLKIPKVLRDWEYKNFVEAIKFNEEEFKLKVYPKGKK